MFGVELAGLLEDPTVFVGMISWLIRVAVNLTRSVQYPIKGGWSVLFGLKWLLPLAGFQIVKSGVDRCIMQSFVVLRLLCSFSRGLPLPSRILEVPESPALLLLRVSQLSSPVQKRVIRVVRAFMDLGPS